MKTLKKKTKKICTKPITMTLFIRDIVVENVKLFTTMKKNKAA